MDFNGSIYITMCKIYSKWEFAVWHSELNPVLSDNLERWNGVGFGMGVQEGETYVYLWLIHAAIWQRPTQSCKAIILQ